MSEFLETFKKFKEDYQKSLSPEVLFVDDFLSWGYQHLLLYDLEPTKEQIGIWVDRWIKTHPELIDKLFLVGTKQSQGNGEKRRE